MFYNGIQEEKIINERLKFESDFGKKILADLGVEGNYEGIGHCALGYAAAELQAPAPRKENYIYYIK